MSIWLGMMAGSLLTGGDFESIATLTVGSGGASSIEFTSIPSTYQHLQIRGVSRSTHAVNGTDINVRVGNGSADSGSNYSNHLLLGDGSTASSFAYTSKTLAWMSMHTGSSASASIFGATVLDIIDYASTSKNTTMRALGGHDRNGGGFITVASGLWMSTSAVNVVRLIPLSGTFVQYSTFALYGIKAP